MIKTVLRAEGMNVVESTGNVASWRATGRPERSSPLPQVRACFRSLVMPRHADPLAPLPAPAPAQVLTPRHPAASIRSCSRGPRPRSTSIRSMPRDTIGIVDFSKPSSEPRFHLVDLADGEVESHRVCHGRGSDPAHSGYRRALLQRFRLLRDVERHLHHRRLLRWQVRPFDEGPRPRLVATTMPSRARSSSTTPGMPRTT